MPFEIRYSSDARRHLRFFRPRDVDVVLDAVDSQLSHQPLVETAARKKLRENPLSTWELRAGDFRVFYDVDPSANAVNIRAVGRKIHNRLWIGGKEYTL